MAREASRVGRGAFRYATRITHDALRFRCFRFWPFVRLFFSFADFCFLLFLIGFSSLAGFHGANEQPREQAAAEQRVEEKLPGVRPTRGALRQGAKPSRQSSGVLEIVKGVEEPGGSVRDEIE